MSQLIMGRSSVAPFIEIVSQYQHDTDRTETALQKINSGPNGKLLLNEIKSLSKNGRMVSIHVSEGFQDRAFPILTESQIKRFGIASAHSTESNLKAEEISRKRGFMQKGEGVSSIIDYDPSLYVDITPGGRHEMTVDEDRAFIALAHELVHAYRNMNGTHLNTSPNPDNEIAREELRVIGTGEFKDARISENRIRADHGLPLRTRHKAELSSDIQREIENMLEQSPRR